MMLLCASIRACASDCSMSYGARRKSKEIDEFSAWNSGSCGSEKRDMARSGYGKASAVRATAATCTAIAQPRM